MGSGGIQDLLLAAAALDEAGNLEVQGDYKP